MVRQPPVPITGLAASPFPEGLRAYKNTTEAKSLGGVGVVR